MTNIKEILEWWDKGEHGSTCAIDTALLFDALKEAVEVIESIGGIDWENSKYENIQCALGTKKLSEEWLKKWMPNEQD